MINKIKDMLMIAYKTNKPERFEKRVKKHAINLNNLAVLDIMDVIGLMERYPEFEKGLMNFNRAIIRVKRLRCQEFINSKIVETIDYGKFKIQEGIIVEHYNGSEYDIFIGESIDMVDNRMVVDNVSFKILQ